MLVCDKPHAAHKGLFRCALIIPFNRVFKEHEQDKRLKQKLIDELPGILNLALEAMGNGAYLNAAENFSLDSVCNSFFDQLTKISNRNCD